MKALCQNCDAARQSPPYKTFDPLCLHCGARYLQSLDKTPLRFVSDNPWGERGRRETRPEREAWRAQVRDTWESFGHKRVELEKLATGAAVPYQPQGKDRS